MKLNTYVCGMLLECVFTLKVMLVSSQYIPPVPFQYVATFLPYESVGNVNTASIANSYQPNALYSAFGNAPLVSQSFQNTNSFVESPSFTGVISASNVFSNSASNFATSSPNTVSTSLSSSVGGGSKSVSEGSSSFSNLLLPPTAVPNGFAKALFALPSLQKYLNIVIPGYQAAELHFKTVNSLLSGLGNPSHETYAKISAQNIGQLETLSVPFLILLRTNVIEKFLLSKGIVITPVLSEVYANYTKIALESKAINDNEALFWALIDGPTKFLQSLGVYASENENANFLVTTFNTEVVKHI